MAEKEYPDSYFIGEYKGNWTNNLSFFWNHCVFNCLKVGIFKKGFYLCLFFKE